MSSAPKNLHENLPLGSSPPRAKNNKTAFHTEEVDICDGEVKLIRTQTSNKIWQVRIWVRGEGKYFRKSLRTKDLEQAKEKAKSIYYKMMGQVEIGKKIFSISATELVDSYIKHQEQRVEGDFITKGRLTTIKTQMKHFIGFVGETTRIVESAPDATVTRPANSFTVNGCSSSLIASF